MSAGPFDIDPRRPKVAAVIHDAGHDGLEKRLYLGPDPYGPRGGACGTVGDAALLATYYTTRRAGTPDWMSEARRRLEYLITSGTIDERNYRNIEVVHTSGTRSFAILMSGGPAHEGRKIHD